MNPVAPQKTVENTDLGTIPNPLYRVELVKEGRKRFYQATAHDGSWQHNYPGVTGTLAIIGGEKTQKLIGWAKKESLASVKRELLRMGPNPVLLEPDTIDGIISRASKKPKDILEAAADYGTRLHDHCDRVIKGLPVSPEDDLEHSVLAFQDWFKASGLKIVLGDTAVASITHSYGGKFDAVAVKDGCYVIIDFKTSSGIREEAALQAAAYGKAFEETYGLPAPLGLIVRFDKTTPTFETKWVKNMDDSFNGFLAAKNLQQIVTGELFRA